MDFWISFWTYFFFVSLAIFAGLAGVVTIGGFFNIRALFRSLTSGADREDEDTGGADNKDQPAREEGDEISR